MTYLVLCAVFVGFAGLVAALTWRSGPPGRLPALLLTALVLVVLTAVFDNVMIAVGLFAYAEEHISGWRIGLAPVEDFAYPIAGLLLLTSLQHLLRRRRAT
ncbi:lycopene cyclase domain-containing protein [Propionibacteriaceae bacterium Y2011]|uniref:lycopene cyclase domain-containing protein n=1 Tax=Microlunatus sp. Y2014 TaxID=3418488 RepID=UPI003B4F26A8